MSSETQALRTWRGQHWRGQHWRGQHWRGLHWRGLHWRAAGLMVFVGLILGLSSSAAEAQDSRRRKTPSVDTPSRRSKSPKRTKSKQIKAQRRALEIFRMLRLGYFDAAERALTECRRQGLYKDSRQALMELWPSPEVYKTIVEAVRQQPPSQRRALLKWLGQGPKAPEAKAPEPKSGKALKPRLY